MDQSIEVMTRFLDHLNTQKSAFKFFKSSDFKMSVKTETLLFYRLIPHEQFLFPKKESFFTGKEVCVCVTVSLLGYVY